MKLIALMDSIIRHTIVLLLFTLTACGGGGGGGDVNSVPSTTISSSSLPASSSQSSSSSTSSARSLSKIEIRVPTVDDWAYITVNGLRHRIGYWGQPAAMGEWRDISDWFVSGDNQVRLQAINYGGQRALKFELRVDGTIVSTVNCPSSECIDGTDSGTFLQKTFTLSGLLRPATSAITINSFTSGKIYINDEYVGLSTPATLDLPKGSYKIGIGVSNDNPQDLTDSFYEDILALGKPSAYNLSGSFYEQSIIVNEGAPQSIYIDKNLAPLSPQNTIKIAVLPFERVMSDDMKSPLILTQEMIDGFAEQIGVTGDRLAKPSMYGLSKWEVTVLPMDKILNVHAKSTSALVDTLYTVSWRPEYAHLFEIYDVVVIYQSSYHADGEVEPIFAGGMTTSGRLIHVTSGWTWTLPSNAVNRGFYHEMYHQYENWEVSNHHYYNGIAGLHGQREHGFTGGGASVQEFYRLFARGQAGEDPLAKIGIDWPTPLTNAKPFPIGVFHAVRYGRLPKEAQ